jgi:hypothetical protein
MSIFNDIDALITSVPSHIGYAPTGALPPYAVSRPLLIDDLEVALAGNALDWDFQFSIYCVGASVEASYNIALDVMRDLNTKRVGGTTLTTSMGYAGAQVEGLYESQVTVQLNQGGI